MNDSIKPGKAKYVIAIIVVVVLALTNPAEEKHKQSVFERIVAASDQGRGMGNAGLGGNEGFGSAAGAVP